VKPSYNPGVFAVSSIEQAKNPMRALALQYVKSERFVACSPEMLDAPTWAGLRVDAAFSWACFRARSEKEPGRGIPD
jgi:hypothetical protein